MNTPRRATKRLAMMAGIIDSAVLAGLPGDTPIPGQLASAGVTADVDDRMADRLSVP
jgi:hypothetical protein